jgi:hypothetical protein
MKYTSENINKLEPNQIFVYGANLAGIVTNFIVFYDKLAFLVLGTIGSLFATAQ